MPHNARPIHEVKAAFFRVLGHPARVRILELLHDGERSVGTLQTDLGLDSAGTSQHLAAELLQVMANIKLQPVAYRGTPALLPDLLAGRVTMSFANISNVAPLVKEGKLRAFAVTSLKRSAVAPDLPTMIEAGYPGFEAVPWFGLMAPAGTSPAIIGEVHRETVRALAMPDVRNNLNDLGLDLIGGTPAELAATIEREIPQWAKVIKGAGIRLTE